LEQGIKLEDIDLENKSMNSTPSQLNMHYGACPKKIESRHQTIIKTYREHYDIQSIPKNKQYWTICGRCSYAKNQLEDNCEPDQIIKSNLVKPSQFHGIEISEEIYKWNKQANKQIHWHLGDFYETMVEYSNHNVFNPAIVNSDMLLMPKYGTQYLSKVMQFLTTASKEVMLVGNFVTEHRHFRADINDIMRGLQEEPSFQFAFDKGNWKIHNKYYWYKGTGKNHTRMTTIILFKNK